MRTFRIVCLVVVAAVVVPASCIVANWAGRAARVVGEEVDPANLLRKYEWFKDASASLDRKTADIALYDGKIKAIESDYKDTPRTDWARDDRQQVSLWRTELDGLAMSYNQLAAEYNSQMAKINWRFCNAGMLPEGQTQIMPREYRAYIGATQ